MSTHLPAHADSLIMQSGAGPVNIDGGTLVQRTLGPGLNSSSTQVLGAGRGPIASLRAANFNSTADQAIAIPSKITAYHIDKVLVTNCSTSLTLAAGGFYTATSKGGTAIIAAAQLYSALTGATIGLEPTLVAAALTGGASYRLTGANVYLSLTTAQGGAATCDVYLFGDDLT